MKVLLAVSLLSAAVSGTSRTVYKCEEAGTITYTDRPCSAGATAHELPGLIVAPPPSASERALAARHDARLAAELADRDRADADWLKRHGEQRGREEKVRKAIIAHRAIKGMTVAEVRQALGDPEQVGGGETFGTDKEAWTYRVGGETRVVNFKNGEVLSTSTRHAKRRR
jgi:hypothetical protein